MHNIAAAVTPASLPSINCRTLFFLSYSIILVAALLVLADYLWLGHAIRDYPFPQGFKLVLLGSYLSFPHVLASLLSFAEPRYLAHYRRPLLGSALFVLLTGIAFMNATPFFQSMLIVVVSTYHSAMQQFGVSLMVQGQAARPHVRRWRWASTLFLIALVFLAAHERYLLNDTATMYFQALTLLGVVCLYYFYRISSSITTSLGRWYFTGDVITLVMCYGLYLLGYNAFAVLIPVFIHSVMAYIVYIFHDENRNHARTHNWLYKLPRRIGISPALLHVASIPLGMWCVNQAFGMVILLNMWHCYIEAYVWKRGTPHREQVVFAH